MTPTIQTQIELLQDTKDELRIAIMEKGVTVYSSDLFSTYPTRISQISMTPGDKDSLFSSLIDRSITGSFDIPQETMKIRSGAFAGCLFSSVTIPDSVTAIDPFAFFSCTNLTSVTIPASVETISNGAFEYCSSLTSVTCLSDTPAQLYGNVATVFPGSYPIYVPSDSVDVYKTAWPTYASRIVANVNYFNKMVDRSISGDYTIPSDVTSIGRYAFQGCESLTSVTIPSSVTSIGYQAFAVCYGLTSVTVLATTPPTLGTAAFYSTNNCPIYVPAASVSAYQSDTNWSEYASRIQAIPNS